jgi:HK97 family phage major capsid protein
VKPKPKPPALNENWEHVRNPSQAEFRSEAARGELPRAFNEDAAFWKYLTTPPVPSPLGGVDYGLDREEHRVLSKASSAAGGYLVPTTFDELISSARRARAVIGAVSRELITGDGTTLLVPTTTTHGVFSPARKLIPAVRTIPSPIPGGVRRDL